MDAQTVWILILAISTPIAGIVGFAIQLRTVKKVRLENEKLLLEIRKLERERANEERRIVEATTADVFEYTDQVRYSRKSDRETWASYTRPPFTYVEYLIVTVLAVVAIYFVYDVYRFVVWLAGKF